MALTEAVRAPIVISHIGDFRLPFGAWNMAQMCGFGIGLVSLFVTRGMWTQFIKLPSLAHVAIMVVVPFAGAQLLSLVKTDGGRNPLMMLKSVTMMIISETIRRVALRIYYGRSRMRIKQFVRSAPPQKQ